MTVLAGALLVVLLAVASFAQWRVGLADNGDYTRHMLWVSSGPVGFDVNFPKEGTPAWTYRFYGHPLANWKLDFPLTSRWVSSILPLWVPGVLANMLFHDRGELLLPYVSLGPRLLTLLFLAFLLVWIRRSESRHALLLTATMGLPAVLLLSDRNVVAYFTSFFQEPASLLSLLFLLAVLLLYRRRGDTPWMPWLLSLAVFGIQAAKLSNAYWAGLILLFVFPWPMLRSNRKRAALYLLLVFVLPFGLSLGQASLYHSRKANAYQSLYCGVLMFSDHPEAHLRRLGMPDGMQYVGHHAYGVPGRECISRYSGRLTHGAVLDVIAHEPVLAWRMLAYPADSVQRLEVRHLGKRLLDNRPDLPMQRWSAERAGMGAWPVWKLWSDAKQSYFPRGKAFLLSVLLLALLFIVVIRRGTPLRRDLAWLGLLAAVACVGDMWMQIFGDGTRDLIKHLFLVNVLYDIALVLGLNLLLLSAVDGIGRRSRDRRTARSEHTA